ncbi:hypothetical protein NMG60_11034230 [Bertholletia excelsa]
MNYESYPPLFRPETLPISGVQREEPKSDKESQQISVIDLQRLNREKLAEACRDWGMFRLVNHGVPKRLLSELRARARDLLSLPFGKKQALFGSGPVAYFWGTPALTPAGLALERGPNALNINWVEGFNVPLIHQLSDVRAGDLVLDSFRALVDEYGKHLSRLATTIFNAMAEDLKLGEEQRKSYLSPATGILRVYRYPCCPDARQAWGMDVHTDSSVLSILNHDQVGGLQVYKDDQWLDVKPVPDTLVVNVGDMMQAISNDEYKSVKHRVKANRHEERISIGYFVFPAEGGVIRSSRYKPFSYDDFRAQVQQDLSTVGFKVGLDRFRLQA